MSCNLPLEHPYPWSHPETGSGSRVPRARGVGAWPQALVSFIPAPRPELPWWVETAFTACGCHMWFWNFPTPPMIGCPAPHTLPQAQIGHTGRLSSYPLHPWGGARGEGGCHLATCVVRNINPSPRSTGGELGAELRAEALWRGPHPYLRCQLCPVPGAPPLRRTGSPGSVMRSK